MIRKVFFSFDYEKDYWRTNQIRNIGVVERNEPVKAKDWEAIKGSDEKIKRWIDQQLKGRSCVIVLIGERTAGRRWINYEIEKAWRDAKGLLGIHIHKLRDNDGNQSYKGENPFDNFSIGEGNNGRSLASIVGTYDNPYTESDKTTYKLYKRKH